MLSAKDVTEDGLAPAENVGPYLLLFIIWEWSIFDGILINLLVVIRVCYTFVLEHLKANSTDCLTRGDKTGCG